MSIIQSKEWKYDITDEASVRPGRGVPFKKSPLRKFTHFYFLGGTAFIGLYGTFGDPEIATFLAVNWLAVGLALVLIAYGAVRKGTSEIAAVIYLLGIAWLILLFSLGMVLIWNDGIGVQEMNWLLADTKTQFRVWLDWTTEILTTSGPW